MLRLSLPWWRTMSPTASASNRSGRQDKGRGRLILSIVVTMFRRCIVTRQRRRRVATKRRCAVTSCWHRLASRHRWWRVMLYLTTVMLLLLMLRLLLIMVLLLLWLWGRINWPLVAQITLWRRKRSWLRLAWRNFTGLTTIQGIKQAGVSGCDRGRALVFPRWPLRLVDAVVELRLIACRSFVFLSVLTSASDCCI